MISSQVDFSLLDAIIVVKTLGHAFEKVKNSTVPLIWVRDMPCLDPTLLSSA